MQGEVDIPFGEHLWLIILRAQGLALLVTAILWMFGLSDRWGLVLAFLVNVPFIVRAL